MSALGQKRTCAVQKGTSALPPIATAKADSPQTVMSALPSKADMGGATRDVRYGPIADINDMPGCAATAGERDGSGSAFASRIQRRS
jgi:hypothetical protein